MLHLRFITLYTDFVQQRAHPRRSGSIVPRQHDPYSNRSLQPPCNRSLDPWRWRRACSRRPERRRSQGQRRRETRRRQRQGSAAATGSMNIVDEIGKTRERHAMSPWTQAHIRLASPALVPASLLLLLGRSNITLPGWLDSPGQSKAAHNASFQQVERW